MDKKLETILKSITLSEDDINAFGETALWIIQRSEALHDPTNDFEYLKNFLSDAIFFLEKEIQHTEKYSPEIFHPNVPLSRREEQKVYIRVLESLKNDGENS